MKKSTTIFFQILIVLIGIGTLVFMFLEPHLEGRNVDAALFKIYFTDPFLVYVYVASIAFFAGLYHAFRLVGYIGQHTASTQVVVRTLRNIQYCAIILVGFILGAEAYFFISMQGKDDIAGGVMMGLTMLCIVGASALAATVFAKRYQAQLP